MSGFAVGDAVRFAHDNPRNHALGTITDDIVWLHKTGRVRAVGRVPNGPKAGVPVCDVEFRHGIDVVVVEMVDQSRFAPATGGDAR